MKKCLMLAVFLSSLFFIFACEKDSEKISERNENQGNGKINITTTIFPLYDFIRQIAGDKANLKMLLPLGAESHSYEPTPQDIIDIQNSSLFVYIGGESDEWMNKIFSSMNMEKMKLVKLIDSVNAVEEEIVEGMQEEGKEEGEGETENEEKEYDEHLWTSPRNAIRIVEVITAALSELDTANAKFYRRNSDEYITKLTVLDLKFKSVVKDSEKRVIVFGDRFPLRYFADEYNLKYFAAFPGCSAETEPSAKTLAFLIDKIKSEKIPVVFHIELSNEKIAKTISEATGAKNLLFHSVHNVSKEDFDSGKGYFELMDANVQNLKTALE
ncbi:periplasmic divalent manganese/zinc-binding lipoprotein [Fibrobacterales bacterium]|nr:periplasmic divalent manganese/zinc-binding lipoprotein [Fibrobacterales bacterium]